MIAGISMMKDEEDVAGDVIRHMAEEGLDLIIVADNMSNDNTRHELEKAKAEVACEVIIIDDPVTAYLQSEKMTALAQRAAERGAIWVIPFDADEVWFSADSIGVYLDSLAGNVGQVQAELYNHFSTSLDGKEGSPFSRLQWRQVKPGALPKVAFRWNENVVIEQGNHAVQNVPGYSISGLGIKNGLEIRHFPYRSWEQFKNKVINGSRAYAETKGPLNQGAHWRSYGEILERHGEEALKEVFDTWFHFLSPVDAGLVHDPAPVLRWRR